MMFAAFFVYGLVLLALRVVVFKYFWLWFVADRFRLGEISLAEALGLMILFDFLRGNVELPKRGGSDEELDGWKLSFMAVGKVFETALTLGLGYAVTLFL